VLLGDGLLTIDGEFHRQQRRLVQPAFHKHRIEAYAETMVQLTQEELATWQPSQEINIAQAMQRLTLRINPQGALQSRFAFPGCQTRRYLHRSYLESYTTTYRCTGAAPDEATFSPYSKGLAAKQTLDNLRI